MPNVTEIIQELPAPGLIPVALLFLVGLVLWVAGRKVLRTAMAVVGLGAGVAAGFAAADLEFVAPVNFPGWAWAIVGAVVVAAVAAAAYRLVLTIVVAALIAALAPVGVLTATEIAQVDFRSQESVAQSPLFAPQPEWWREVIGEGVLPDEGTRPASDGEAATPEGDDPGRRGWLGMTRTIFVDAPVALWKSSPEPLQWIMGAAAVIGALLGLVLGAAAPSISAALVTAMLGSGLLIGTAWTFATRLGAPLEWMPTSPIAWISWWMVTVIIGLGLQWTFQHRRADKAAG